MIISTELTIILITVTAIFALVWSMVGLIRFTKSKRINTELWCTVFEGLTQGAIRLDDLKNPQTVIEKKIKRDGRDRDSFIEDWLAKEKERDSKLDRDVSQR